MATWREALEELQTLWSRERAASTARLQALRAGVPLAARVLSGDAVRRAEVAEVAAAPGDRTLLWLTAPELDRARIGPGDPVRLWWTEPDDEAAQRATVARYRRGQLGVMVDGEVPDRLLTGHFNVDRDDPQATFDRGDKAIAAFRDAPGKSDEARLRQVLWGELAPAVEPTPAWTPFDAGLDLSQMEATDTALGAREVALVHGPPGTGKTRTLVEIARQLAARGETVLACAMSNVAVDNLAERLADAGVEVVRLGHPARVAPAVEARSLDRLIEQTEGYQLARSWMAEARQLRHKIDARRERGTLGRNERIEMHREARRLEGDARAQLRRAQAAILDRCQVVLSTAAGADADLLAGRRFDVLLLDEATQAPDPVALVPLRRVAKVVMAGDPEQLPPTVLDLEAERAGLGRTIFERVAKRWPLTVRMLNVQYRMHADLMAFPSESRYRGKLEAHPSVAGHRLEQLPGVAADPLRDAPLVLIDTAGKGWDDAQEQPGGSSYNEGQAARTEAEVRRLLGRGLAPVDLAVITPYDAQRRRLTEALAEVVAEGLEIGTVDGFQGREKEAIVVDLVRSNAEGNVGFVSDRRRLNVALTRARRLLMVIADTATLGRHADFAAFLEVVEARGAWISAWNDDAPPFDS